MLRRDEGNAGGMAQRNTQRVRINAEPIGENDMKLDLDRGTDPRQDEPGWQYVWDGGRGEVR